MSIFKKMKMKKVFLLLILFSSYHTFSQNKEFKTLFGIGGLYNFQTEGIAFDGRAKIPIFKKLFISPRLSYFPSFNNVHELYAGTDLGIDLPAFRNATPYIFAGGYYNDWFNSAEFHNSVAKKNNLVYEAGVGIVLSFKCFYPYAEYRYDAKWKEGSLGVGLMLKFGECFYSKKNQVKKCPGF